METAPEKEILLFANEMAKELSDLVQAADLHGINLIHAKDLIEKWEDLITRTEMDWRVAIALKGSGKINDAQNDLFKPVKDDHSLIDQL